MNQELIYRITRAVYEQLGPEASEKVVEQLVTEVYRAIEPTRRSYGDSDANGALKRDVGLSPEEGSADRLIISVFGVDHPGIVAGVSQILAAAECSIVDINQTVVQGKFAMVIIADMSRARDSASQLKDRFRKAGESLGVTIYAQREDLFNAMHRI
jgi:ACT domain-containing protein